MKKVKLVIAILMLFGGCSTKKDHDNTWPELDAFHKVMAKVYHPLKDSGNLSPVKDLINDLTKQADVLAASKAPKDNDDADMHSKLENLKSDAHSLSEIINSRADDALIKEKLTLLHEHFHKIMEAVHQIDEKDEHHQH